MFPYFIEFVVKKYSEQLVNIKVYIGIHVYWHSIKVIRSCLPCVPCCCWCILRSLSRRKTMSENIKYVYFNDKRVEVCRKWSSVDKLLVLIFELPALTWRVMCPLPVCLIIHAFEYAFTLRKFVVGRLRRSFARA